MWFTRDYTKSMNGKTKTQPSLTQAKHSFGVAVAMTILWMVGTHSIVSANKLSRQTTSNPRSGAPQKPSPPKPSPPSNTPLRPKFFFLKNAAGNAILQCDTSTGTIRRAEMRSGNPLAGANGQYVFVILGSEDIKACNVMTGHCYTAPKVLF